MGQVLDDINRRAKEFCDKGQCVSMAEARRRVLTEDRWKRKREELKKKTDP